MSYTIGRITSIRTLTQNVKEYTINLEREISAKPGQFAMLWVPRIGEIPLSFTDANEREVKFIIAKVGKVTSYIHNFLEEGSKTFIRGPFGNGFTISPEQKCLLVAGGCGLAPLYFLSKELLKKNCYIKALLGFKTDSDVFYEEEFKKLCTTEITVEQGEKGFKGTVVDLMIKILDQEKYDIVYTCGKESMMARVVQECVKRGVYVEASLERYIKCGLGVCGSCVLEPLGLRVCRDGPVFSGEILTKLTDFGRFWRNSTGRKINIDRLTD